MRIISVGQVMDLEHAGEFVNQFTVRLDDGSEVAIVSNEETVAQLLNAAARGIRGRSMRVTPPPAPEVEETATYFGDTPDPGESMAPPVMGTLDVDDTPIPEVEEEPALPTDKLGKEMVRPPKHNAHPNKKGRAAEHRTVPTVRARTVSKDELGYPVVPRSSRVDGPHRGNSVADDEDGTSI